MRNYAVVVGLLCVCVFHRSFATPAFGLAEFLHSKSKGLGNHGSSESKAGDGDHDEITTNEVQSSELENTAGKTFGGLGAAFGNTAGKPFGGIGLVVGKTAGKPLGGLGSGLGTKLGAKLGHAIKELGSGVVNTDETEVDSTQGNTTDQVEKILDSALTDSAYEILPLVENGAMNKFVNQFGHILPWGANGRPTFLFGNSGSQGYYKGLPGYLDGNVRAFGGMFGDKQPSEPEGRSGGSYFPNSLTGSGYSRPQLARKKHIGMVICVGRLCWHTL